MNVSTKAAKAIFNGEPVDANKLRVSVTKLSKKKYSVSVMLERDGEPMISKERIICRNESVTFDITLPIAITVE